MSKDRQYVDDIVKDMQDEYLLQPEAVNRCTDGEFIAMLELLANVHPLNA